MSWRTVFEYALGGIVSTIFLWLIPNIWNKYKAELSLQAKLKQRLTPKEISKIIKNFDRKYDEEDVMLQIKKGIDKGEFKNSKARFGESEVDIKEYLTLYQEEVINPIEKLETYGFIKDDFEDIELEGKDVWKWFENFRQGKYNDKTQIHVFKYQLSSIEKAFFDILINFRNRFSDN